MSTEKKPDAPVTLNFLFSPVGPPTEDTPVDNPHVKATTDVRDVIQAMAERFADAILEVTTYAGEYSVRIGIDRLIEIARFLKEEHQFNYLSDLGGIDRFTDTDRFEVFYNLVSLVRAKRIRMRVRVDESSMEVPSMTAVYRAANWNEREVFDMFGLRFTGHPDLRRMYMPEDFEYYPLRKEFPLLGVPGSLPLPPQTPEAGLTLDPYAAAHGSRPVKSFDEQAPGEPE